MGFRDAVRCFGGMFTYGLGFYRYTLITLFSLPPAQFSHCRIEEGKQAAHFELFFMRHEIYVATSHCKLASIRITGRACFYCPSTEGLTALSRDNCSLYCQYSGCQKALYSVQ